MMTTRKQTTGCTLFAVKGEYTPSGNVLIGSTSDNEYLNGPRKPVWVNRNFGPLTVIHTPCLLKTPSGLKNEGSDRGMNSAGFCWTRSWSLTDEEYSSPLSAVEWFEKLGGTVRTVDEGIEFMTSTPRPLGANGNFIIGDQTGFMAVVELGHQIHDVCQYYRPDETGLIIRVNRFESDRLKKIDVTAESAPEYNETSDLRYARVRQLITDKKVVDIDAIKDILADRSDNGALLHSAHGAGICSMGRTHGTVSSEIYNPASLDFYYSYGFPGLSPEKVSDKRFSHNEKSWGFWKQFNLDSVSEGKYTSWQGDILR